MVTWQIDEISVSELGARSYLRDFAGVVETDSIGADGAVWDRGQKLWLESFRADVRKYLVQRWDRFPREFLECNSLEVFKV